MGSQFLGRLILNLDARQVSSFRRRPLYLKEIACGMHCIGGRMGSRGDLNLLHQREIFRPCAVSNRDSLVIQPIALITRLAMFFDYSSPPPPAISAIIIFKRQVQEVYFAFSFVKLNFLFGILLPCFTFRPSRRLYPTFSSEFLLTYKFVHPLLI